MPGLLCQLKAGSRHGIGKDPSPTVLLMETPNMTRPALRSEDISPSGINQLQALDDVGVGQCHDDSTSCGTETTPLSFVQLPQLNYWLLEVSDVGRSDMAPRGGSVGRTDVISLSCCARWIV